MRRINMTFPDAYFTQLQENAAQKGVSFAIYMRSLVEIGLQVEEASAEQILPSSKKNNATSTLSDTKDLWKNTLLCVLESRYLIRYLVDSLQHQLPEERDAVVNTVKEKAQTLVAELLKSE